MNDEQKSTLAGMGIVFTFLALLILSSCTKDNYKALQAKESYVACLEAQKGTPVDLDCGNVKEIK